MGKTDFPFSAFIKWLACSSPSRIRAYHGEVEINLALIKVLLLRFHGSSFPDFYRRQSLETEVLIL